jgi:hypothetical protein
MKLIRFSTADSQDHYFGVVVQDKAVPFLALQCKSGELKPHINDSRYDLANPPDSQRTARKLFEWCERNSEKLEAGEHFPENNVRLLEP